MNKAFFLDIFNKILRIGDKDIFIIFDIKGEIWLSFKSLVSSLEYSSYTKQLTKLKYFLRVCLINVGKESPDPSTKRLVKSIYCVSLILIFIIINICINKKPSGQEGIWVLIFLS